MGNADRTPPLKASRQLIEAYGGGGFRVGGERYQGSVLVFPDRTVTWPVTDAAVVSEALLAPVIERASDVRVLLLGCGRGFAPIPAGLAASLRARGIGLEWMDTGAACRTFNVLLLEDREIAAALIAVD